VLWELLDTPKTLEVRARAGQSEGKEKAGGLNLTYIRRALAYYRRLAIYNGFFVSLKYLFFEMIGRKKLVLVQYVGHRIFARTCSPDMLVAFWCLEANEFKILKEISVVGSMKAIIDGGSYV
jgi:hypothetical protein